jgi:predicted kinase
VARDLGVPCAIVDCQAPESSIRRWIRARAAGGRDISEADERVLDRQLATAETLTDSESAITVHLRTDRTVDGAWLLEAVRTKARIPTQPPARHTAPATRTDR